MGRDTCLARIKDLLLTHTIAVDAAAHHVSLLNPEAKEHLDGGVKCSKVGGECAADLGADVNSDQVDHTEGKQEQTCDTDEEVKSIARVISDIGGSRETSMLSFRGNAGWLVLPKDVLLLHLPTFDALFERAGWTCIAKTGLHHDFLEGETSIRLYSFGVLLVRTSRTD